MPWLVVAGPAALARNQRGEAAARASSHPFYVSVGIPAGRGVVPPLARNSRISGGAAPTKITVVPDDCERAPLARIWVGCKHQGSRKTPMTLCRGLVVPYGVRTLAGMRTQRLELRLTEEERSIDQAAAAAVGESLSDFFRRAAANRAADVLADLRKIELTEDEAIRFLDALETVDDHTVARLADLRSRT
jgi:uncharacterized protein (DUF1778 family)